jgi:hypothetical protein
MTEIKKIDSDVTDSTVVQIERGKSHQELNLDAPTISSMEEKADNGPQVSKLDDFKDYDGMNMEDSDRIEREKMFGAGITAGVMTLMLGPIVAIAVGVGVAHGTKSPGATGDVCRAVGDVGLIIREKAIDLNRKHNIVERTKESAKNATNAAKEVEGKHHLFENFKNIVADTWENLVLFEKKHNLLQRTKEGIDHSLSFIGEKMKNGTSQQR